MTRYYFSVIVLSIVHISTHHWHKNPVKWVLLRLTIFQTWIVRLSNLLRVCKEVSPLIRQPPFCSPVASTLPAGRGSILNPSNATLAQQHLESSLLPPTGQKLWVRTRKSINLPCVKGWDFMSWFLWVLYGGSCCGYCGTGHASTQGSILPAAGDTVGWQFSILDILGTARLTSTPWPGSQQGQLMPVIAQAVVAGLAPPSSSGQFWWVVPASVFPVVSTEDFHGLIWTLSFPQVRILRVSPPPHPNCVSVLPRISASEPASGNLDLGPLPWGRWDVLITPGLEADCPDGGASRTCIFGVDLRWSLYSGRSGKPPGKRSWGGCEPDLVPVLVLPLPCQPWQVAQPQGSPLTWK